MALASAHPISGSSPEAEVISKDVFRATERSELLDCAYDTIEGRSQGQAHNHWQVTDNPSCGGAATCGTSELESHTFGIDSSLSIVNVAGLRAGVSGSWTSGEKYSCNENSVGTVCVWIDVAHTIFNMERQQGCWDNSDVSAKFSNTDNAGDRYECKTGDACKEMDANYWD
ncbi:MAG: hypothetical protein OHK93_003763 [Ramalina farinacea]|uniref:Uncharacterized protein n=1 Tax=Ramalina farinacea TaxID=258253 RepID=A0AA43QVN9_9LECA|nr:hypothetical protein [Ramalina farinacea]